MSLIFYIAAAIVFIIDMFGTTVSKIKLLSLGMFLTVAGLIAPLIHL